MAHVSDLGDDTCFASFDQPIKDTRALAYSSSQYIVSHLARDVATTREENGLNTKCVHLAS